MQMKPTTTRKNNRQLGVQDEHQRVDPSSLGFGNGHFGGDAEALLQIVEVGTSARPIRVRADEMPVSVSKWLPPDSGTGSPRLHSPFAASDPRHPTGTRPAGPPILTWKTWKILSAIARQAREAVPCARPMSPTRPASC